MPKISKHPRGAIALLVLLGVSVFSLMVLTSVSTLASHAFTITLNEAATEKTFYAAEAGLNEGLYRLVHNAAPGDITLNFNNIDVLVTIRANPLDPYQRVVTSRAEDATGKVRELEIIANTSSFAGGFDYAVQTGAGGLYMDNNSAVIGNVYSNGSATGSSQAVVRGNLTIAGSAQLDQGSTEQASEFIFGQQPQYDAAQYFIAGSSDTLSRISVKIKKIGSPNLGSQWWRITADDNGQPATTPVDGLAKGKFSDAGVSLIGDNLSWVNINIPTPLSVTAGIRYWIVLDVTNSATDYFSWGKGNGDTYSDGEGRYSSVDWDNVGVVWNDIGGSDDDFAFQTWLGESYNRLENVTVWGHARATRIMGTGGARYARVCGDAYYDTILQNSYNFLYSPNSQNCPAPLTSGTGYPNTPDQDPLPLPIRDDVVQTWKDDITDGGVVLGPSDPSPDCPEGSYCVLTNTTLGNVKIEADLFVKKQTTLTFTGNVWVTGNALFDASGSTTKDSLLKIDSSLGSGSAVLIADGWLDMQNNFDVDGSGDEHSFLLMVSTSNSMDETYPAVYASNNTDSIIFGAPNGTLRVRQGGELNAAVAKQLHLEEGSTVTYNPNLIYFTVPAGSEEPVGTALGTWREK